MDRTISLTITRFSKEKEVKKGKKLGSVAVMTENIKKGLSNEKVMEILKDKFPERKREAMERTLNWMRSHLKQKEGNEVKKEGDKYFI